MTTKVTEQDKQAIIALISQKIQQLNTAAAVATFCGVSPSVISQMLKNEYKTQGDTAWINVGNRLGWKPETNENSWKVVETTDLKAIRSHIRNAKQQNLFLGISDFAGIGKSTGLEFVANEMKHEAVYYMRCKDWGRKELMENVCRNLGIDTGRGFQTPNNLLDKVIEFFAQRVTDNPVFIIDEADKLKGNTICFLTIPMYNENEDKMGMVISGTEALEKLIKHGVKYAKKGFDETDSRFGRNYLKLLGCTEADCKKIANANGIANDALITQLFEECKPVRKFVEINKQQKTVRTITDLRRFKRLIKRHIIQTSL